MLKGKQFKEEICISEVTAFAFNIQTELDIFVFLWFQKLLAPLRCKHMIHTSLSFLRTAVWKYLKWEGNMEGRRERWIAVKDLNQKSMVEFMWFKSLLQLCSFSLLKTFCNRKTSLALPEQSNLIELVDVNVRSWIIFLSYFFLCLVGCWVQHRYLG